MLPPESAAHYQEDVAGFVCTLALNGCLLDPIASLPDQKNENRDQANRDRHPVLAF
jgi:hypothetical protein